MSGEVGGGQQPQRKRAFVDEEEFTAEEEAEIAAVLAEHDATMKASNCDDDGEWHTGPFLQELVFADEPEELKVLTCAECGMGMLVGEDEPWPESFGEDPPQ